MRLTSTDRFLNFVVLFWCLGGGLLAQRESQPPTLIDVNSYEINVEVDPDRSFLRGEARVEFSVLQDTLAIPFSFNRQMSMLDVRDEEGERLTFRGGDVSRDTVRVQGEMNFRAGTTRTLRFEFEGLLEPEQYAFLDVPSTQKAVIDRDGARLLNEGFWFPSYSLATDPASAVVRVTVPLGFSVVAPGLLEPIETIGLNEAFTWRSEEPISHIPVIVARYFRENFDTGPVPLTFYVKEDFEGDLQPFVDAISDLIGFYESEYGQIPFASLTVAQTGNVRLGTTGAKGLVLLEESFFTAHSIPKFDLATRLANQWWGYSVRILRPLDAWLADGFSRFAALRYFQVKQPDEFEEQLAKEAVNALKYQDTAPIISGLDLEVGSPKYESIVGSKGAWILYMLGRLIGQEPLLDAVRTFYAEHSGQPAAIPQFVNLVNRATGDDMSWFFVQWIESVGVPEFRVDYTVFKLRDGTFKIRGQVKQNLDLFRMPMEILIETKGQPEEKALQVDGKTTSFSFDTQTMPVRIVLDPKGNVLMDSERMRIAVNIAIGDEYKDAGEYVSALSEYEKAITLNARSSLAHFRLGETYFEQHSYSNAANSMRDCLNGDLKPDWVEAWAHIYLGKVYDILGQRQRARAEYQKAINSKVEYNGAQEEAQKYLDEPYTKPSSVIN